MTFCFYAEPYEVGDTGIHVGLGVDDNADDHVYFCLDGITQDRILTLSQAAELGAALMELATPEDAAGLT